MLKKLVTRLFTFVLAVSMSMPLVAQENADKAHQEKVAKQGRWEGIVSRNNIQKSTLAVRPRVSQFEQVIYYDSSTQWTSQEHGSSKVNNIDASQVKEGDRVICIGFYDETSYASGAPPSMKIGFSVLATWRRISLCDTSVRGWRLLEGR